mmetsp:Transcript_50253/g.57819  ORF Transcript_50253/g.57819 Transcript_50253/m.57819 type:complete len:227 (-) Transcript_50253:43-723(-)
MSSIVQALFGPPKKSPEEQAKEWIRQLHTEARKVDSQIRKITVAEKKCMMSAKQAAKKDDNVAVRMLSREILHSRKAVKRLYTAKAQMNSVAMQLQQQNSQLKLTGAIQKSTQIMSSMNQLMKVGEIQQIMMGMSKEMTKAGLIDEMVSDTLDSALGDDDNEDELDEEVSKVVQEVVQQKLTGAHVGVGKIPSGKQAVAAVEDAEEAEDDAEADELMAKFQALRAS